MFDALVQALRQAFALRVNHDTVLQHGLLTANKLNLLANYRNLCRLGLNHSIVGEVPTWQAHRHDNDGATSPGRSKGSWLRDFEEQTEAGQPESRIVCVARGKGVFDFLESGSHLKVRFVPI